MLGTRRRRDGSAPSDLFAATDGRRLVLHVGCGPLDHKGLYAGFRGPEWREVRLDIDPGVKPDVVASITDMTPVPSSSVDAVWSHHNIEHVFSHEVPLVLKEFARVLRPGGEVLIATPDLQSVARAIAAGRLEDRLYRAPAGDIAALDVVYGMRGEIERGREYMAHRTGFTVRTLGRRLNQAGFVRVRIAAQDFALWANGRKPAA
ncbi:MAG TPA: methyltransferase domain-containing protein [Conexibacter sp.]|nr:methyltransferase domain-containing protein [Conexibacter sp.]